MIEPSWQKLALQDDEELAKLQSAFRRVFHEALCLDALIAIHMLIFFRQPVGLATLTVVFFPATLLWSLVITMYCFHWGQHISSCRQHRDMVRQQAKEQERIVERERETEKLRAMNRIMGDVAHNFNNILTAVLGFSHLVKKSLQQRGQLFDEVDELVSAAKRAAALAKKLSRCVWPPCEPVQRFTVHGLAKGVAAICRQSLPQNVKLMLHNTEREALIEAPRVNLQAALLDICTNAGEAMPEGGTLTIAVEAPAEILGKGAAEFAVISVADTGVGMEPEIRGKIFDPFFSTKNTVGVGLSLATARHIIENQGGTIEVQTEPGRGTTFRVYLPVSNGA